MAAQHHETPIRLPRRRGFSVLETIVALFILVAATALSAKMLGISLRVSGTVRDEAIALTIAERRLHQIENATADPGFAFASGFDTLPEMATAPDHDFPNFTVSASSAPRTVFSPVTAPNAAIRNNGRLPARFDGCARVVKVTVSWGHNTDASLRPRTLSIFGLVTEPPRRLASFALTPSGATSLGSEPLTLQVQGRDPEGRDIGDLVYTWEVIPLSGNITLKLLDQGNGSKVELTNSYTFPDGVRRRTGGRVRIRVRATCGGRELILDPPLDLDLGAAGPA